MQSLLDGLMVQSRGENTQCLQGNGIQLSGAFHTRVRGMGRGYQGWVVVRKALGKDASSEQNVWPGKGWDSLEVERANEPGAHGG